MPKLILRYCTIENPKADFLKHHIKFPVALPLTDDNLKLRDKFELLAGEKKSVTVEIESAQLPLFGGDAELENIAERVSEEAIHPESKVESVTLSSGGKSVTLDQTTRAKADNMLNPRGKRKSKITRARITRKK